MATNSVIDHDFTVQNLQFKETFVYNSLLTNLLNAFSFQGVDGKGDATFFVTLVILLIFLRTFLKSLVRFETENVETAQTRTIDESESEEPCPICYELILYPVRTNCGHVFCGECMLVLLKSYQLKNIICPMCRLKVRMIQPAFLQEHSDSKFKASSVLQVAELIAEVDDYNVWFSDSKRSFLGIIKTFPLFVRRLKILLYNLDILDLMLYNRMMYVKGFLLGCYVAVTLCGSISIEELNSVALMVIYVMKISMAAHTMTILIRRYRQ